jgi:hypothetical protein
MASDHKTPKNSASPFDYGVRELQQAKAAHELCVESAPRLEAANQHHGFDPYNTSGSFDRKKNWARVGKR